MSCFFTFGTAKLRPTFHHFEPKPHKDPGKRRIPISASINGPCHVSVKDPPTVNYSDGIGCGNGAKEADGFACDEKDRNVAN